MHATFSVKTIGIAYNLRRPEKVDDCDEEYDSPETIDSLSSELRRLGFDVLHFEQDEDFIKKLAKHKPDFVLNLAEGIGSGRGRESQVPCILEAMDIPYSGSDPVTLGITLDKYLTNNLLRTAGIPVPDIYLIASPGDLPALRDTFKRETAYILKPRWEGSSKGIFNDSIISSYDDLCPKAVNIMTRYSQPVVLEKFITGDEITAGLIGNSSPEVIGMMKISPADGSSDNFIYSLEKKRTWKETIQYHPENSIKEDIKAEITRAALSAFKVLELRDVARIDFRLDGDDAPKIIDINPLPGLSPSYSDLPIMYGLKGGRYTDLVRSILLTSFERCGIG